MSSRHPFSRTRRGRRPRASRRPLALPGRGTVGVAISEAFLAIYDRIELDPDIEVVDESDPLQLLLDEDDARLLLRSFRSLPARWQRVLWLSEVAGVARPAIARELRIPAGLAGEVGEELRGVDHEGIPLRAQ